MTHTSHRDAKLRRTWPQLLPHITIPQLKTKLPLNFQDHPQLVILTKGGSFLKYTYTKAPYSLLTRFFPQPSSCSVPWRHSGTPAGPWQTEKKSKQTKNPIQLYSTSFHFLFLLISREQHLMGSIFTNAASKCFIYFKHRRKQTKYRTTYSSATITRITWMGQKTLSTYRITPLTGTCPLLTN